MFLFILSLSYVMSLIAAAPFDFDVYCTKVTCNLESKHIVCARQHKLCKPGDHCFSHYVFMNMEQNQLLLKIHNELRNKVAGGANNLPTASNMRAVNWDYELGYIAECTAGSCLTKGPGCMKSIHNENLFGNQLKFNSTHNYLNNVDEYEIYVQYKFFRNSLELITKEDIKNFTFTSTRFLENVDGDVAEFAVLAIVADITHVGCGAVKYKLHYNQPYSYHTVCLYRNIQGSTNMKIYEEGIPCSSCGSLKCNKRYKNLCGEITPMEDLNPKFWQTTTPGSIYSRNDVERTEISDGTHCIHSVLASASPIKCYPYKLLVFILFIVVSI